MTSCCDEMYVSMLHVVNSADFDILEIRYLTALACPQIVDNGAATAAKKQLSNHNPTGLILYGCSEGDCPHAPWSLP